MLLTYEQTIQGGFSRNFCTGRQATPRDCRRFDSETNTYFAEVNVAQARANELIALAQLYTALGGGWQ